MCKGTFIVHSTAGGRDMALNSHRYPSPPSSSPHYVPLPSPSPLSATATAMKNMHIDDDGRKKQSGSSYKTSPRSVLESNEGLGRNRNRVGFALEVAATPQRLGYNQPPWKTKKSSIKHDVAQPMALPFCHIRPTPVTLQEEEEEEEVNDSFLWASSESEEVEEEEEEEREREGYIHSIFSVGSPLLVSALNIGDDDEEKFAPALAEEIFRACFLCKRSFADGKDIYIYRGEQAFCSEECRYHQILMDERRPSSAGEELHFSA